MPRIDVGGHRLWYEEHGQGPPVLLVHPLFFDHRIFQPTAKALAPDHRAINVDVRCHGRSDCPDHPFDLWQAADELVALVERLEATPVHWVGLSMGGMIGMRAALRHPGDIASLTLIDTSAGPEARALLHKSMAWTVRLGGRRATRLLMPYVNDQMFSESFQGTSEALVWQERLKDQAPRRLFRQAMAVFDRDDVLPALEDLDVPAMVVYGEEDRATPPVLSRRMAEAIEGARLANVPGAGHLSVVEQPDRVNDLIKTFLHNL